MITYPLKSITIDQAKDKQFKMVECIMRQFPDGSFLSRGDLGLNKEYARKAENAIADFFGAEAAILVTGSGTGAIRFALMSVIKPGGNILVHTSPIYPTTQTSFKAMGLNPIMVDFHDMDAVKSAAKSCDAALVQLTRQKPDDSYCSKTVIQAIADICDIPIITDDNYAVMKIEKIGCEMGANLSCFSSFKLLGPEGVGIVVGDKKFIDKIETMNYSGGSKVQGWQAMDTLRGLVYAPVSLAIQAEEGEKCLKLLKKIPQVKDAFIANAQSKVLLVEFSESIARDVITKACKLGAIPGPVGAESKYEIPPMFYKVSGTFLKSDPSLIDTMIRINPNRASAETIVNILKQCF
ncbi:MAG: aminotransferase class I/II-fold pyridoxal phosphate-dependent enzyme [Coriobacteriia bacterium]|nr:aminotransferase class I/II-fold pyridoxal phosphate-dependent enzyme [Coriobacteriia bacterium]